MDLRKTLSDVGDFLEGDDMTGREAAIVVAVWMGVTALFGLVFFLVVFVFMGF
ncbi:hypothetical protein [Natrarchaeobaculum sulfurireducens]|uniref:Uncharacterized protein n=1 Tax=Natrarchaeobaculum sulfurireducens TaxID=2044521 RepID=A0A346PU49_9EURY|nr:hypothetical protein [Natrarchaeobaculum sulfurireducens]AXR76989.1 hypothetical protein AArc1_0646 [Natrarchaeobaculum sulfurireducens]AXR83044.1 hypothetical protein AArcMg_3056 [Natrarchaeobaculum sulfurireducens]